MNYKSVNVLILAVLLGLGCSITSTIAQGVDDPIAQSSTIFVLQDFVDNFEHGLNAGGETRAFGTDAADGVTTETDANLDGRNGSIGFVLQTVSDDAGNTHGFSAAAINDRFILMSKTFATSTDSVGNTSNSIDASDFNAISYFVKDATGNTNNVDDSVQIEIVIGDGGGFVTGSSGDRKDGSTWTQREFAKFSSAEFTRIAKLLNSENFARSGKALAAGDPDLILTNVIDDVTAINILLRPCPDPADNCDSLVDRKIIIDDINFFGNPRTLTVTQSRVFVPNSGVSGTDSDTVIIKATVTDTSAAPGNVRVGFRVKKSTGAVFENDEPGSPFVNASNPFSPTDRIVVGGNGTVTATFSVSALSDILSVEVFED